MPEYPSQRNPYHNEKCLTIEPVMIMSVTIRKFHDPKEEKKAYQSPDIILFSIGRFKV